MLSGVVLCFLLSGFAALLYQTAWLRQFSLVFGTSELAVATVLAAYMGGLALGAAVAGRLVGRIRRPVLVYGLLEAGIAISALAVPLLLDLASALYGWALGGRPDPPDAATLGQPVFYLVVAMVILAIPTSFMGATLPLLTRHVVTSDREVGPRVALLYATNTAGAVLGALTAGFALLPALGLRNTVLTGAAVNLLVFLIAVRVSRAAPPLEPVAPARPDAGTRALSTGTWILPLMLVSGATSFAYEVLWTRLLTHVLGGGIYAFAAMLAAFLIGIALGGGAAGRLASSRGEAAFAFALAQVGIALLSMGVYTWMGPLIPEGRGMSEMVGFAIAVMLPATVFIGATFPLAVRVLARNEREAASCTARIYAWNTVGAIAGAVLTGFWLLPALGFADSVKLAICTNGFLALVGLLCASPLHRPAAGAVLAALLATLLLYHPARPEAVLASTEVLPRRWGELREIFYAVGRSATVLVVDASEDYWLLTNGMPEASIQGRGSPPARDAQTWLTALATIARPDTESMLVVGLGGGSALGGVPSSVRRVDVVELEPEVVRANRALQDLRSYDPLADERVRVIVNDARNALRLTNRLYDAIVSQPSHPWTAGASHLFTREFVQLARSRLEEGGVFVQWMSNNFLTVPLLRSLSATLLAEFRSVRLYRPTNGDLLFLASDAPLEIELELERSGRPLRDDPDHFHRLGISSVEDLVAALVTDHAGLEAFAAGAPFITDDRNSMATHSRGQSELTGPRIDTLLAPHDPLLDATSWVHEELGGVLDFPHLARRLIRMHKSERAGALARVLPEGAARHLVLAELQADAGRTGAALQAGLDALEADPDDAQSRYFVFRQQLTEPRERQSSAGSSEALDGLDGSARAVGRGWQLLRDRDWPALAALDHALSRSRVTDIWYPDAVLLRARWRLQVDRDRQRLASEALHIVDSGFLTARDVRLHLERLRIALELSDEALVVESARSVVGVFEAQLDAAEQASVRLPPASLALMRQNLVGIARALDREFPAETRHRARVVHAVARDLLQRVGASPGPSRARGAARPYGLPDPAPERRSPP